MLKNINILTSNVKKTAINNVETRLAAPNVNEMYAVRIDLVLIFLNIFMEIELGGYTKLAIHIILTSYK